MDIPPSLAVDDLHPREPSMLEITAFLRQWKLEAMSTDSPPGRDSPG